MYREAEGDSECCLVTRGPGPRSRGWAEAACEAGELEAVRECCFLSGGELWVQVLLSLLLDVSALELQTNTREDIIIMLKSKGSFKSIKTLC